MTLRVSGATSLLCLVLSLSLLSTAHYPSAQNRLASFCSAVFACATTTTTTTTDSLTHFHLLSRHRPVQFSALSSFPHSYSVSGLDFLSGDGRFYFAPILFVVVVPTTTTTILSSHFKKWPVFWCYRFLRFSAHLLTSLSDDEAYCWC